MGSQRGAPPRTLVLLRPLRPSSLVRPQAERSTGPRAGDSQDAQTKHCTEPVITVQGWAIPLVGRVGCTTALEVPRPQVLLLRPPETAAEDLAPLGLPGPSAVQSGRWRVSQNVLQQDRGQLWGWGLCLAKPTPDLCRWSLLSLSGTSSAWVLAFETSVRATTPPPASGGGAAQPRHRNRRGLSVMRARAEKLAYACALCTPACPHKVCLC